MIPVPNEPNLLLVDGTSDFAPRIASLMNQLADLMNGRMRAIDEKFPQMKVATDAEWDAIPEADRAKFITTRDLEQFAVAAVLGAMAGQISRSMDAATMQLLRNMSAVLAEKMGSPVPPGHTLVVRYIPVGPPGVCTDPDCPGCKAKREKEFRERA